MDRQDQLNARRLLEGVVPDEIFASYSKLLAEGGCPEGDASSLLGGDEKTVELTARGMAHLRPDGPMAPPRLVPAPPELALQGVLAELSRRLVSDQERLLAGHRRLSDWHQTPAANSTAAMDRLVQIVTDRDEISRLSYALINAARHDWLTLDNYVLEAPVEDSTGFAPLPVFEGQVQCRAIYETRCAEHPIGAKTIEAAVEAGEQARLLPRIGMKMKLADEAVALLPLTPTGMSGALLVRSPVIVGALREYFELLWERAIPYGSAKAAGPLTPAQSQVLRLLTQGLPDEAIARQMDISVNTMRRHWTAIRDALGVETRFAAGAAAVRRGWIN
ncbi:helix-turn-helix transcriptional regulator [Spongiactinospora gelatinilytica]|uniref:helix-turn-helix transcriptional regulator n=1 Tax=Spongiactinospora gelatinilytica TaxID=2666298 RepID=UPI0011B936BA|nr:LuxR C-terminal-related transcriptional regulator [Spongiactinospora gelatinilytica]